MTATDVTLSAVWSAHAILVAAVTAYDFGSPWVVTLTRTC